MSAPVSDFSFSKKERLNHKIYTKELFEDGSFFRLGPLLFRYLEKSELQHHQILITVPKKNHKRAVMRNKLKRRIREAYRLNKQLLPDTTHYLIAIIYLSKEESTYFDIHEKLRKGLGRLHRQAKTAQQ